MSIAESPKLSVVRVYEFGDFRVDASERLVFRSSQRVDVKGKALDVLLSLLGSAGSALSKEALMRRVWAESAVEEANLTVAISQLRKALREAGSDREYIETLSGRGYRFLSDGVSSKPGQSTTRLRAVASVSEPKPTLRRGAPLIGRESDLAQLEQVMAEVRAGGHGTVLVMGQAGSGKTAFVETFLARVASEHGVWIARAACSRGLDAGEPYLPFLAALRGLCRGAAGATPLDVLKRVAPTWAAQLPELSSDAEFAELRRRVTTAATPCRLLSELGAFVDLLSPARSIVWCIEDLHWADTSTLELLAYLARRSDLSRTLIVASLRAPEQAGSTLDELCNELWLNRACQTLRLQPLTQDEVNEYLDTRFSQHDFPASLARLVHERTHGTPLFVAQWADALHHEGLVRQRAGVWSLTAPLAGMNDYFPEATEHTIELQVDRLSPAERALLDAAAVCGETFAVAAVAEMLQRDPVEVEQSCLAWARQHRFLRVLGERNWADGTSTMIGAFSHAFYQELLYRRLGAANRTRLQLRLAECLQRAQQGGEE